MTTDRLYMLGYMIFVLLYLTGLFTDTKFKESRTEFFMSLLIIGIAMALLFMR